MDHQVATSVVRWKSKELERNVILFMALTLPLIISSNLATALPQHQQFQNGFHLYTSNENSSQSSNKNTNQQETHARCSNGLLTFELSTGFIYKPASVETLAMMPSTLQLTDCLDYCLQNSSCAAINFEMGLCVLLSSSAKQNPLNLYSSQFPVFTIYAEKKCLLSGDLQVAKQRRRCQRAWTFERVAGYEMKTRPRRRLKVASKENCMELCLLEREFECRSANWYRQTNECTLSDQDRHSVSQSEAGDQQIKASLHHFYGLSNLTSPTWTSRPTLAPGLYENFYNSLQDRSQPVDQNNNNIKDLNSFLEKKIVRREPSQQVLLSNQYRASKMKSPLVRNSGAPSGEQQAAQYVDLPANALVDYLENNCIYEPNKLCEFRKIKNRILKTVDSIYQDITSLEECKQKCLNAPYRCYSFDYGDTSERVCRTSHLDQASLLSVREPYLDVVGAITYELASCFNVTIQCRAREMVAQVSASKNFRGKIYVKSRPNSCVNDVRESLQFELSMKYHDEACDVRASSTSQQGVFSNDIVIQHHDRIVTTQDVGLSVYCQYDLGNKSITNNVDLAIERIEDNQMESKNQPGVGNGQAASPSATSGESSSLHSPLVITSLATTVVKSPNVTMRITNMNGQPVTSATVGDRLALLFEVKEKSSPFGIFVREVIALDGKQMLPTLLNNNGNGRGYHYGQGNLSSATASAQQQIQQNIDSLFESNKANSVQIIDSEGCPTDSNIMGPLARLDDHRLLAPFDAFKFPTSDMVFFRAVVTSCVSECKPAICGDSIQEANPPIDPILIELNSPSTTPTMFTDPSTLISTSRNMPASRNGSLVMTTTTTTTFAPTLTSIHSAEFDLQHTRASATSSLGRSTTTLMPTVLQDLQSSTGKARTTTTLPQIMTTSQSLKSTGDSLTTVPGFGGSEGPILTSVESDSIGQQLVNMTNNHQQGRAPILRPTSLASSAQTSDKPAITLDSLTPQQKQQIVKMFAETKLRQQQQSQFATSNETGSISDLADLYASFLTSIVLTNSDENTRLETSEDSNYKRQENDAQEVGSGKEVLSNNKTVDPSDFFAYLLNEGHLNKSDVAGISGFKQYLEQPSAKISKNPDDVLVVTNSNESNNHQKSPDFELAGNYLDNYTIDLTTNASSIAQHQSINKNKSQANNLYPSSSQKPDLSPSVTWSSLVDKHKASGNTQLDRSQPQVAFVTGNGNTQVAKQKAASLKAAISPRENQKEAISRANSYLAAYQSFGKRRRRRQAEEEELTSSGYVYMSQPLAPSDLSHPNLNGPKFTRGFIEMYHTNHQGQNLIERHKRNVQPSYDMDELVVQSIKIVDKLQFHEDQEDEVGKGSRLGDNNKQLGSRDSIINRKNATGRRIRTGNGKQQREEAQFRAGADERIIVWSSFGALGAVVIGFSFVLVQVFLVVVYVLRWNGSFRDNNNDRLNNGRQVVDYAMPLSRSSSMSTLSSDSGTLFFPCHSYQNSPATSYTISRNLSSSPVSRSTGRRGERVTSTIAVGRNLKYPSTAAYLLPNKQVWA